MQCALERLAEDDPRRLPLEERDGELLAAHDETWAGPLADFVSAWKYRRGFIEEVTVFTRAFLDHAAVLFASAPVRRVHLRRATWLAAELGACSHLGRLSGLSVSDRETYQRTNWQPLRTNWQPLLTSPHLGGLRSFNLRGLRLDASDMQALAASPHLAGLEELDLSENSWVGGAGVRALAVSPCLNALTKLHLENTHLTPEAVEALAGSHRLDRLTALNVGQNLIGNEGVEVLARSPLLPRLTRLGLASTSMALHGVQTLAACDLSGLTSLDVGQNLIGPGLVRTLVGAGRLPRLTRLHVGYSGLGDAGVQELAAAPLDRLTALDLCGNGITSADVRALAASPVLAGLRELDVSYNAIGADGMEALLEPPHLRRLKRLTFVGNGVSPKYGQTLWRQFRQRATGRDLTATAL